MSHTFDKEYWERHWAEAPQTTDEFPTHPSPYVVEAVSGLRAGTALDAGCGNGTDANWLAAQGWHVTGADISAHALATAAEHASRDSLSDRTTWIEVDLTTWTPQRRWDLVITNYAHPAMPQLDFYQRIAEWVAPGGSLLIVGHRHDPASGADGHASEPPAEATAVLSEITARLDSASWRIDLAEESTRSMPSPSHHPTLRDVVVKATRLR